MALPNPNGTLCRFAWKGSVAVTAGTISTTLSIPLPGDDDMFVSLWPTWPAGGYEASRTGRNVTITWQMPAPIGGGTLRWKISV